MCRIAAYLGPEIPLENIIVKPQHSLLTQSQHATEAKLAVNGDGFGIAWYGVDARPGLYRDVLPAWADGNLTSLCRMIRSRLFISHIRASTVGETSRANCHPFTHRNWSFCHNGQVPHIARIRREIETQLPDEIYALRRGTTDSELMFLLLLANGLDHDPSKAMAATIKTLSANSVDGPVRITCVLSDGESLFAMRYASDQRAPSLYLSGNLDNGGRAVSSEPLSMESANWSAVPPNKLLCLTSTEATTLGVDLAA